MPKKKKQLVELMGKITKKEPCFISKCYRFQEEFYFWITLAASNVPSNRVKWNLSLEESKKFLVRFKFHNGQIDLERTRDTICTVEAGMSYLTCRFKKGVTTNGYDSFFFFFWFMCAYFGNWDALSYDLSKHLALWIISFSYWHCCCHLFLLI